MVILSRQKNFTGKTVKCCSDMPINNNKYVYSNQKLSQQVKININIKIYDLMLYGARLMLYGALQILLFN